MDISIFVTPPRRTHCLDILLCASQYAMSEFAASFKSVRFHRSRLSGIRVSVLGASIPTCASAVNRNLVIVYLSLHSLYIVRFRCLQHALPHSMNVCVMLDLQYLLSVQHCLYLLAIFPMNSCSHPSFVCCWNAVLNC